MKNKKFVDLPLFACPSCGKRVQITFNPDKEKQRWAEFICPSCGVRRLSAGKDELFKD